MAAGTCLSNDASIHLSRLGVRAPVVPAKWLTVRTMQLQVPDARIHHIGQRDDAQDARAEQQETSSHAPPVGGEPRQNPRGG